MFYVNIYTFIYLKKILSAMFKDKLIDNLKEIRIGV